MKQRKPVCMLSRENFLRARDFVFENGGEIDRAWYRYHFEDGNADAFLAILGGDWSYTELAKLRMKKVKLGAVNFTGANLFDCRLEGCDLTGARFDNAIVNQLVLRNSNISGASFSFVNFAAIDFKGCTADLDFAVSFTRAHGIRV